jgi:hypothetical protein
MTQSSSLSLTTSRGCLSPNTVITSCDCSFIFWVPHWLSLKSCLANSRLGELLQPEVLEVQCFVFKIDLSKWSCCCWIQQGLWHVGLVLLLRLLPGYFSSPQSKPLPLLSASGGRLTHGHCDWESQNSLGSRFFKSFRLLSLKACLP